MRVDLTKILEKKAARVTAIVALITGYTFLGPWLRDQIIGDEIINNNEEIYEYVDRENKKQDSLSFEWELYFVQEFIRVDERYEKDSLLDADKNRYFAVGLRADKETGALHYRNREGILSPVKPNDTLKIYMFKPDGTAVWLPCYYEE